MKRIKLGIRYIYIALSSVIALLSLLYLLLIFLLEYLSYNPQYVEEFIDNNIDIEHVDYVKLKRKGHSLNINVYDLHIDKHLSIPKMQFKLNPIKSLFSQELVFDSVNLHQIKFDINNKKIINKLINHKSFNQGKLEIDIGKILTIKDLNIYLDKYFQILRKSIKQYKFIRNIRVSNSEIILGDYRLFFDEIKIKTSFYDQKYFFKLMAFAKVIHDKISENSILFAVNLKSSKHNHRVFSGKVFSHLKNAKFSEIRVLNKNYSGQITSVSNLLDIKHNRVNKIKVDLNAERINDYRYEIDKIFGSTEYAPDSGLNIKNFSCHLNDRVYNNFYSLSNGNLKVNFPKKDKEQLFNIIKRLESAKFSFNAKQLYFWQKNIFKKPLTFNNINSNFSTFISTNLNQLNINIKNISGNYNAFNLNTKGAVILPYKGNRIDYKSGVFASISTINNLAVNNLLDYLPFYQIDKDVAKWIDDAFIAGKISKANIVYRGGFNNDFPYDYKIDKNVNGKFTAEAYFDDITLEYLKKWPNIKKLFAKVYFDTRDISFDIYKGNIYSSTIEKAHGYVENTKTNYPNLLHIDGRVKGSSNDIIKYLQHIDHKVVSDDILSNIKMSGNTILQLDINEKLGTKIPTKISGKLDLDENTLLFNNKLKKLSLNKITGQVNFDNDTLKSKDLKFKLFENELDLKFDIVDKNKNINSNFKYSGYFDKDFFIKLNKFYSNETSEKLLDHISKLDGSSKFSGMASVNEVNNKITKVKFNITSNLKGLSSTLDYPFAKKQIESKVLNLAMQKNGRSISSKFDYDNFTILLNEQEKSQDVHGKIIINHVSLIDLVKIRDFIHKNQESNNSNDRNYFLKVYINNGTYDKEVKLVGTIIKKKKNKANVFYFNLESLELTDNAKDFYESLSKILNNISNQSNTKIHDDIKKYINIKKLFINNILLGQLEGVVYKDNADIKLNGKLLSLEFSKKSDSIKGSFGASNVGNMMEMLGVEKFIDKSNIYINFDVSNLYSKNPKGDFFVMLKNGVINKVHPGIGRLLGAFSFSSLQRKLRLDFSDITGKSYAFDQIIGNLVLDNNNLSSKDIKISGPSADIDITGEMNIKNDTYNLLVDVTPKISGGVPVAAAIASGNPAVGVIVWAVDKLLQSPFDKISRSRYSVKGSVTNPEVNKIKIG